MTEVPEHRIKELHVYGQTGIPVEDFVDSEFLKHNVYKNVALEMGLAIAAKLFEFNKVKFEGCSYWAKIKVIVPETPK